jgi:hypothetical protein
VVKSRRMSWAGDVARVLNYHGNIETKRLCGGSKHEREDNVLQ